MKTNKTFLGKIPRSAVDFVMPHQLSFLASKIFYLPVISTVDILYTVSTV